MVSNWVVLSKSSKLIYCQDPNAEMRVMGDKMKEMEKRIETLTMECTRWQEEAHELNLKCQTFEAQLEQRQAEFRQQLMLKEVLYTTLGILLSEGNQVGSSIGHLFSIIFRIIEINFCFFFTFRKFKKQNLTKIQLF